MLFRAHGKLLLSGEYAVLDGALALALPTKPGQTLVASVSSDDLCHWISLDDKGEVWFRAEWNMRHPEHSATFSDAETFRALLKILEAVDLQSPGWLKSNPPFRITTSLEFPRNWGLGSSSTLISLIAQWTRTNPYHLLKASFGGSGYDLACATANGPIVYQRQDLEPLVKEVSFRPSFRDRLWFVHLNQKQNSREGIQRYRSRGTPPQVFIEKINEITSLLLTSETLERFEALLVIHETLIGTHLGMKPVRELLFDDFQGTLKSLGAWGGDFILATGTEDVVKTYFSQKGFTTIVGYDELILT